MCKALPSTPAESAACGCHVAGGEDEEERDGGEDPRERHSSGLSWGDQVNTCRWGDRHRAVGQPTAQTDLLATVGGKAAVTRNYPSAPIAA